MTTPSHPLEAVEKALERLKRIGNLCADGCQGRCLECPADVLDEAMKSLRQVMQGGGVVLKLPIPDGHYEAKDGVLYSTTATVSPECTVSVVAEARKD